MKRISLFVAAIITLITVSAQKTIYLNSKTTTCNIRGVKKECLQYKLAETDTVWSTYSGTIKGFTYNPGYFYTLQVSELMTSPPQWKLMKQLNKTKSKKQQQPGDSSIMVSQPPKELIGQWNFTKMPVDDAVFTKEFLNFDAVEMRVNGKASCNGFFGNYTADTTAGKKEIHFEALGHTMMACENLATENKMLKAMEAVTSWSISGNKLYLKAGDTVLIELTRADGKI